MFKRAVVAATFAMILLFACQSMAVNSPFAKGSLVLGGGATVVKISPDPNR